MIEFFTLMCEHPGVFFMVIVCALIFIGMTYDFILKLFKRQGMGSSQNTTSQQAADDDDDENPYEECYVEDPDDTPPDAEAE